MFSGLLSTVSDLGRGSPFGRRGNEPDPPEAALASDVQYVPVEELSPEAGADVGGFVNDSTGGGVVPPLDSNVSAVDAASTGVAAAPEAAPAAHVQEVPACDRSEEAEPPDEKDGLRTSMRVLQAAKASEAPDSPVSSAPPSAVPADQVMPDSPVSSAPTSTAPAEQVIPDSPVSSSALSAAGSRSNDSKPVPRRMRSDPRVSSRGTRIGSKSSTSATAKTAVRQVSGSDEVGDAARRARDTVIRRAVLATLEADGLKETAACLRLEAGIVESSNAKADVESAMEVLLAPGVLPAEVSAVLRRRIDGSTKPLPVLSIAESTQLMAEQRKSFDRLQQKIRALREEGDQMLPLQNLETGEDHVGPQMEAELDNQTAKVESLRKALQERREAQANIQEKLKKVKEETDHLVALNTTQPRIALTGQQAAAEHLRRILATWELPGGARRSCSQCFARVDTNHDGRLEWNNGEIRTFVRNIFKQLAVQLPQWQDPVWYDLYRRCDVDGSFSLDLEESFRFAKTCLETALHCLDPVLLVTSSSAASIPSATKPPSPPQSGRRSRRGTPPHTERSSLVQTIGVGNAALSPRAAAAQPADPSVTLSAAAQGAVARAFASIGFETPTSIDAKLAKVEDEFLSRCWRCFQNTDTDRDRLLLWNSECVIGTTAYACQIRGFVASVLDSFGVPVPPWIDTVFDEAVRAGIISRSSPVDFDSAHKLAQLCFDMIQRRGGQ